jgi:hypothetical protein
MTAKRRSSTIWGGGRNPVWPVEEGRLHSVPISTRQPRALQVHTVAACVMYGAVGLLLCRLWETRCTGLFLRDPPCLFVGQQRLCITRLGAYSST